MQVLIIDALNLIRRIYAAQERPYLPLPNDVSDATARQIVHNTSVAIEQALDKLMKTIEPSHGLVVFDGDGDSWRSAYYPEYKAGRSPMPMILEKGMAQIKQVFADKGFALFEQPGQEADDLIGALAAKLQSNDCQATIVSTDKGFLQLLSDKIRVYDYFARKYLDDAYVIEKFGVEPSQLINYWSLVGDSSNNIPGLPGVGPKSALDILLKHDSFKAALLSEQLPKKLKEKLHNHLETFKLCRKLVALKLDIELGLNLKDIRLKTE